MDKDITESMGLVVSAQSIKNHSDLALELATLSLSSCIGFHLVSKVLFISSISVSTHSIVFLMNSYLVYSRNFFFVMTTVSAFPDAWLHAQHNGNASKDYQHKSCLDRNLLRE
jgi:hypothetical protein